MGIRGRAGGRHFEEYLGMRRTAVLALVAIVLSACNSSTGGVVGSAAPSGGGATSPSVSVSVAPSASTESSLTPTPGPTASPTATPVDDSGWELLAPPSSGFTARFPSTPTLSKSTAPTAAGDASTYTWAYSDGTHLAYVVGYIKYPAGSMAAVPLDLAYDAGIKGLVGSDAEATIDSQEDITLEGHDGKSFTAHSGDQTMLGQVFLVGDRLFMVFVLYDSTVTDHAPFDVFFADFDLNV
jgi:predicted small secreted protein